MQDEEDARILLESEAIDQDGLEQELIEDIGIIIVEELDNTLRRMLQPPDEVTAIEGEETAPVGIIERETKRVVEEENRTTCEINWLSMNIVLQCLFIAALLLNLISLAVMRVQLVNRIKNYFYYKEEPEIAIKY